MADEIHPEASEIMRRRRVNRQPSTIIAVLPAREPSDKKRPSEPGAGAKGRLRVEAVRIEGGVTRCRPQGIGIAW